MYPRHGQARVDGALRKGGRCRAHHSWASGLILREQLSKICGLCKEVFSRARLAFDSRFLHGNSEMTVADYERLREQTLDEMIAAGEITEQQRDKVFFVRFLAADQVERGNGPPVPRRRESS